MLLIFVLGFSTLEFLCMNILFLWLRFPRGYLLFLFNDRIWIYLLISGDPPTTIDLDEIGFWDDTVYPFDMGDEDSHSNGGEFELGECLICGQIVTHGTPWCPYTEFVPHDASLPPGIQRVCRCCGKRDGHTGEDWEACAIPKRCFDCGAIGEHWTRDSDCPTKTGKPRCDEKPDSYQQTGRTFLFLDEDED